LEGTESTAFLKERELA